MAENENMSEAQAAATRALFAKWAKARGEVKMPALDCENPHFRNKYASLGSCLAAVLPACRAAGIVYQQIYDGENVRSMIWDGEGNSMMLSMFPIDTGLSPQATGSALTYAKRQALCIDFGIVGEPDDDGEEATREGDSTKRAAYKARINSLYSQLTDTDRAEEALQLVNERGGVRNIDSLDEQGLVELGTSLSNLMAQVESERREREEAQR